MGSKELSVLKSLHHFPKKALVRKQSLELGSRAPVTSQSFLEGFSDSISLQSQARGFLIFFLGFQIYLKQKRKWLVLTLET